ncbi:MAG: hypothetical protein J0I43_06930 [Microbacterium sp.]|uniref:hypothetical protein n=1 Tax=Microbacterium sp. TaxID=51671 RepID=UPI001AC77837|nr:hypothetical protein [Microbacterium sp.]MBN9177087.1 hypothetical protein [Microbacterium sp.]
MIRERRFAAGAALVLALTLTTACTPSPAPTPTPTGFASEEKAFAAAEATYRAYVDATNGIRLSDPETFEPVYAELTGDALSAAKKSFTQMHADGWTVAGESRIALVKPQRGTATDTVELLICVDVSDIRLTDEAGVSQVGDRPKEQSLMAVVLNEDNSWLISSFAGREGEPLCTQ